MSTIFSISIIIIITRFSTFVENAFINKLIIIGKLCVSKFKYRNHPNLTMLLHQELRLRNIL